MNETSCAFTGHRPQKLPWKYDETDFRCVALKSTLAEQISLLVDRGVTDFLSGMAQGVDLWAALFVLFLKKQNPALRLHCILPYEGQEHKWPVSEQERYRLILRQADSVDSLSREYYDGCMIDRNRRLVESAGILLAVYNGHHRSGTGATIRYAQKRNRKIIIILPGMPFFGPVMPSTRFRSWDRCNPT